MAELLLPISSRILTLGNDNDCLRSVHLMPDEAPICSQWWMGWPSHVLPHSTHATLFSCLVDPSRAARHLCLSDVILRAPPHSSSAQHDAAFPLAQCSKASLSSRRSRDLASRRRS